MVELDEHAITDLLEDILLDVLLIKQYTVETIVRLFEDLRRRERDPVEVSYILRLIPKLQKLGLPGVDILYSTLTNKTKDNLNTPNYYLNLRDDLEIFLKRLEHRYFIDALNNLADLLGDVMRHDCENRYLAKLVL